MSNVAFSPDGQRLATASSDSTAKIWDLGPAHELLTIPAAGTVGWWPGRADTPQAGQVAVSQDGGWVMSGLEDGTARVWDTTTGEERWVLRGNRGWTLERVRQEMETGGDNVTVSLTRQVPVFIVYTTAIAYENDEVHFYDDIYGHDAKLAQALAQGYP